MHTGAVAVGAVPSASVPVAMAMFGKVIIGTGTIHAAGGVAATLQSASAFLLSSGGIMKGAALGAFLLPDGDEKKKQEKRIKNAQIKPAFE